MLYSEKCVGCTKKGMEQVQFLTEHFTILGIQAQNWMLVAAALVAVFVAFVTATRDHS